MKNVYILWHENPDNDDDAKLIGVYSTNELALEAQLRFATQKGFSDYPANFSISEYTLNQDHWAEGFVTVPRE